MTGRPRAHEMVEPRKPNPLAAKRYKVTARYDVLMPGEKRVRCIRVSGYGPSGNAVTLHLEQSVFKALFMPARETEKR